MVETAIARFKRFAEDRPLALFLRLAALMLVGAVALTACTVQPQEPAPPVLSSGALDDVVSACDEHGNRVYKWRNPSWRELSGLGVVGHDPSCKQAPDA